MKYLPTLLVTMGDVAGVGPEIIARAWPKLCEFCRPVVVGDPDWMAWAVQLVQSPAQVRVVQKLDEATPTTLSINVLSATAANLQDVQPGRVTAAAGQAAYDFLCRAIDLTRAGAADGIVTAPLHKEGLRAAGLHYPGHTEILAKRCGVDSFGMVLYLPPPVVPQGLAVVHVTLHCALRDVFAQLSVPAIADKVKLVTQLLRRLGHETPHIGVAALNPHASDGGLFGDEEERIIRPAVELAQQQGMCVSGPHSSDTLFGRARKGEFAGIVAMYHDQGHIALKLLGEMNAVNISVGLPLVRTSVAHGTAYDIAGRGVADAHSLVQAAAVAAQLCRHGSRRESVVSHSSAGSPS